MAIIKTLDNFNDSTELAPTQANFPALKHFFPCDETSGLTITDSVGGVVITPDTSLTFGTNHVVPTMSTDVAIGGTWELAGLKKIVIIQIGVFNGAASDTVHFGTSGVSNARLSFLGGTGKYSVREDVNQLASTVLSGHSTNIVGQGFRLTPASATGFVSFETDNAGGSYSEKLAIDATTWSTGISVMPATAQLTVTKLYSTAIFFFDTLPNDLEQAVTWMYNEHVNNGNKTIWPGWNGRS